MEEPEPEASSPEAQSCAAHLEPTQNHKYKDTQRETCPQGCRRASLGGAAESGPAQHVERYTVRGLEPSQPDSAQEVAHEAEPFPSFYKHFCGISTIV